MNPEFELKVNYTNPEFEFKVAYVGVIITENSITFEEVYLASVETLSPMQGLYEYKFYVHGVKRPMEFDSNNVFRSIKEAKEKLTKRYNNMITNAVYDFEYSHRFEELEEN